MAALKSPLVGKYLSTSGLPDVGGVGREDLMDEAARLGLSAIRVLSPTTVFTQDLRGDRLNVRVDSNHMIMDVFVG